MVNHPVYPDENEGIEMYSIERHNNITKVQMQEMVDASLANVLLPRGMRLELDEPWHAAYAHNKRR